MAQGASTITAALGNVKGTATLTITAAVLTSISVSPANASVQIGSASPQKFTVNGTYSDQSVVDLSSQATWSVTNPYVANIDTTGAASPQRIGFTRLTAAFGSLSSSASLTALATPRYLFALSDADRDISRLSINAANGQPQYMGYQKTGIDNSIGFGCVTTDPSNHYAYLSMQVSAPGGYTGQLLVYSINATADTLTPFPGNPYSSPKAFGCVKFEPSGSFAYATPGIDNVPDELVTFAKDSNGNLSILNSLTLPSTPGGLAIDPLGKFLYVISESVTEGQHAFLYGYSIDPSTGSLTPIDGTPFQLSVGTYGSLSFNPSGDYLYLADASSNAITGYSVSRASGALTGGAASAHPCINPTELMFSPDGSLAFTGCSMDNNHGTNSAIVVSFAVAANGQLTQIGTAPASGAPRAVYSDSSGQFLYTVNWGTGKPLATYKVNQDGTLALQSNMAGRNSLEGLLLEGGALPVTYTTQFAYVATSGDDKLTTFQVNPDGTLLFLTSTPTLALPFSVAMLPWHSDLLLVARNPGPDFQGFATDDSNGTLSSREMLSVALTPGGVVIDPSGRLAFESDPSLGLVYAFGHGNIPGSWGLFVTSASIPFTFTAESGAGPLAIDPAGRSLFVANQTANSISQFQWAGAPPVPAFPLPASPLAICSHPSGLLLFEIGSDSKLRMLAVDPSGSLTDIFDVTLSAAPTAVVVEPSGHYVYVSSGVGLAAFSIDQVKGSLTAVQLSSVASLANVTGVYVEPTGQYLYASVANSSANSLYRFIIQADGTLSGTDIAPIAMPGRITAMTFHTEVH